MLITSQISTLLQSIVKKNGGEAKDWKQLLSITNTKPEE